MACDELKKQREEITKQAIKDHQLAKSGGTSTGQFKCGKCGKRNTTYNQVSFFCFHNAFIFQTNSKEQSYSGKRSNRLLVEHCFDSFFISPFAKASTSLKPVRLLADIEVQKTDPYNCNKLKVYIKY